MTSLLYPMQCIMQFALLDVVLLSKIPMLGRIAVVLDIRPPHWLCVLDLLAQELLRPDLLPQAKLVVVDSSNFASSSNHRICRTLAEARKLELQRRQRQFWVGRTEELYTTLVADPMHSVGPHDLANRNGPRGIQSSNGDPLLQPREGKGGEPLAGEVDEAALRQQAVEGSLTSFKSRCRLAVSCTS